jgi:tight adherence protein C
MSTMQIAFLALVFVVAVATVLGVAGVARTSAARQRLHNLGVADDTPSAADRWIERIARFTRPIGRLSVPEEGFEQSNLKLRFVHAGIRGANAPVAFFGVKTLLTLGLPGLVVAAATAVGGPVKGNVLLFVVLLAAAAGYYLPNLWLGHRVSARQREIFESFPDALDLMTVCVEAGLGTEAALTRVAEDLRFKSPALGEEMTLVNLELRAGADREHALRNLAIRTGVDEVDGFVTMITQAERFGTSIAASLRIHAEMLRTRRRQRAEEAAAKIALKLLFPLIFCIFPSLMVVLMGPAMIQVYRVMLLQ